MKKNNYNVEAIRPQITAKGFRTAVKDYTEEAVIEELAANAYDEMASTVVVLLNTKSNELIIFDDGSGFNDASIREVATLGGGDKSARQYHSGKRVFLGSYGYGLKSSLNIANHVSIHSTSESGTFMTSIDWTQLDNAFEPAFPGFKINKVDRARKAGTGTLITLSLKNPTSKVHLELFGRTLSNLPTDGGKFKCYYGQYSEVDFGKVKNNFADLKSLTQKLYRAGKLRLASESLDSELKDCKREKLSDRDDRTVTAEIFFAGIQGDKIKTLKSALRGIYVRVHGRLLKHNFSEDKYTYGISKYQMFKQGLRAEFSIDWLRDQITLSRDGIKFSNEKLEEDFRQLIQRNLGKFIRPNLEILEKKRAKGGDKKLKQRMELAKKRSTNSKGLLIKGITGGFVYTPETDAELAILLAQQSVMQKIDKNLKLIDYNDQAPFDCILFNSANREFIYTELEPTLIEFIGHKTKSNIELVIVWTLGKWRIGARKKGTNGSFELIQNSNGKKGHYKLLEYSNMASKKARHDYQIIALDQVL